MRTTKNILALVVVLTCFAAAAIAAQTLKSKDDDFLTQKDQKDDDFFYQKDPKGRIIAASKILTDGTKVDMMVHSGCKTKGECSASISFLQNSTERFKVSTLVAAQRKQLGYTAEGDRLKAHWTIDMANYNSSKKGVIVGELNGKKFRGIFNGVAKRATVNLALSDWLTKDTKAFLDQFAPAVYRLRQSTGGAGGVGGGAGGAGGGEGQSGQQDGEVPANIDWSGAGRAACWGLGSVGSFLSGMRGGIPGLIGALASTLAASACSDSYGG